MRVLLLSTAIGNPWSGGIAPYTTLLAEGLRAQGHEVGLLAPDRAEQAPDVRPPAPGNWTSILQENISVLGAAFDMVGGHSDRWDVVHCMDVYDIIAGDELARRLGVPLVVSKLMSEIPYHRERRRGYTELDEAALAVREHFHDYAVRLEQWSLRRADRVVAISEWILDEVVAIDPGVAGRTSVIQPATTVRSAPDPARVEALRRAECAPGESLLMLPGRVTAAKGGDIAIRALARIRDLPVRLVLVGDGTYRPALTGLARELGVDGLVRFTGMVGHDEMVEWYAAADIVLVPSRADAYPLTVLDAMSLGKLVVGSRVGGIAEQIRHAETGLLFENGDAGALAARVRWAVGHPAEVARIGHRLDRIARSHTQPWSAVASRTVAVYRSAIDSRGQVPPSRATTGARGRIRSSVTTT
jgi:glycosyltransferase involved in cell wall biosynthesis